MWNRGLQQLWPARRVSPSRPWRKWSSRPHWHGLGVDRPKSWAGAFFFRDFLHTWWKHESCHLNKRLRSCGKTGQLSPIFKSWFKGSSTQWIGWKEHLDLSHWFTDLKMFVFFFRRKPICFTWFLSLKPHQCLVKLHFCGWSTMLPWIQTAFLRNSYLINITIIYHHTSPCFEEKTRWQLLGNGRPHNTHFFVEKQPHGFVQECSTDLPRLHPPLIQ